MISGFYCPNEWTAFLAAESKSSSGIMFNPLSLIISLAFSMFVPCKRTIKGILRLMVLQAFTIPFAIVAQLTIPAKNLLKPYQYITYKYHIYYRRKYSLILLLPINRSYIRNTLTNN